MDARPAGSECRRAASAGGLTQLPHIAPQECQRADPSLSTLPNQAPSAPPSSAHLAKRVVARDGLARQLVGPARKVAEVGAEKASIGKRRGEHTGGARCCMAHPQLAARHTPAANPTGTAPRPIPPPSTIPSTACMPGRRSPAQAQRTGSGPQPGARRQSALHEAPEWVRIR